MRIDRTPTWRKPKGGWGESAHCGALISFDQGECTFYSKKLLVLFSAAGDLRRGTSSQLQVFSHEFCPKGINETLTPIKSPGKFIFTPEQEYFKGNPNYNFIFSVFQFCEKHRKRVFLLLIILLYYNNIYIWLK